MRHGLLQGIRERVRVRAAGAWLLRLREAELSPREISAWLRWSHAHPRNLEAFEDCKVVLQKVQGLDVEQRSMALRRLMTERRKPLPLRRWLVAASLLAVTLALAAGYRLLGSASQPQRFTATYTTSKAQERRLQLPDGTGVELGAESRLTVLLTPQNRTVELSEGEAFFHVKHDEARRFTVHAGKWRLTDVGTAFNVRKTNDHLVLTVAEGVVDVSQQPATVPSSTNDMNDPNSRPIRLLAGEQMVMDASEGSTQLARIESTAASSWEQGQMRFKDEPLSVVLANLNRYSKREIVVADPEIGTMRFSGTVLIDNVDGWVTAACRVFSLREEVGPDNRIVLRREAQSGR